MNYQSNEPYNSLPLLLPEEKFWKTFAVFEQLNLANKALAELKGRISAIPNPRIFIHTLSLQEAKESSAIENVVTTNDKLFKAFTSDRYADPNTKEVLRYGKALTSAFAELKAHNTFSIPFIENIYRNITDEIDGIRDIKVYIGNAFQTVYTPPCCKKKIVEKLNNWIKVANDSSSLDPLIKMAFLHYQFEAIHPFKDGNGRTGRVLNVIYLLNQNLINEPVLYISKYINAYKIQYYNNLKGVTENALWEDWVLYMLKAVEETAKYTLDKVETLIKLFDRTKRILKDKLPEIYSYELLEVLFTQVYCKYTFLVERGIASRNTASKYLNAICDIGILEKEKVGNEFIFKNKELYKLFS